MKYKFFLLLAVLSLGVSSLAQGNDYESIVRDLTNQNRTQNPETRKRDPLADSAIHVGVGFANNFETATSAQGRHLDINQSGIQAALGIDLLTPEWIAEGTARSFADSETSNATVSLHEFDLKILNKGHLSGALGYRLGGGLSARYLGVDEPATATAPHQKTDYVTPASVVEAGLELLLSPRLSVGFASSYRSALISDTVDRAALDLSIRVDAHF